MATIFIKLSRNGIEYCSKVFLVLVTLFLLPNNSPRLFESAINKAPSPVTTYNHDEIDNSRVSRFPFIEISD